jgi:Neutral/alkaline non-lysosomal ceramidase, N-terminal
MRTCVLMIGVAVAVWVAGTGEAGEVLRIGAAAVKITPPVGTPMAGYYFERAAEGVHDELFAKVLVLEQGDMRAAMVSLDLISTPIGLVEEIRKEIDRTKTVPGRYVMISATHAHTGPVLAGRGLRDDALGAKDGLVERYSATLPGKVAEALKRAVAALTPGTVKAAHGREMSLAFNRRFHMIDGSVGWNPGKLNPKILKPAGPIDPDVAILSFEMQASPHRPLATYVNYAVHLDNIGGLQISADMPGTLATLLGMVKGPEMVTVYTTGCCGDINHINVKWADPQHGFENSTRMGVILAGAVLEAWPGLEPVSLSPLRAKSETVPLPLPKISSADVEEARQIVKRHQDPKAKQPTFLEAVKGYKVLDVEARHGKPIDVEVQVIALGQDVAWVSLPGEIFVELGLAIKQDSPFPHTIVAELANGSIGYIPTRRAYTQGNYEVVSARCAEGSGELLVDAAIRLLKELYSAGKSAGARAAR